VASLRMPPPLPSHRAKEAKRITFGKTIAEVRLERPTVPLVTWKIRLRLLAAEAQAGVERTILWSGSLNQQFAMSSVMGARDARREGDGGPFAWALAGRIASRTCNQSRRRAVIVIFRGVTT